MAFRTEPQILTWNPIWNRFLYSLTRFKCHLPFRVTFQSKYITLPLIWGSEYISNSRKMIENIQFGSICISVIPDDSLGLNIPVSHYHIWVLQLTSKSLSSLIWVPGIKDFSRENFLSIPQSDSEQTVSLNCFTRNL